MNLLEPFIAGLFGSAGSGKTHLTKYICYCLVKLGLIQNVLVLCKTKYDNDYDYIQSEYVKDKHYDYYVKSLKKKIEEGEVTGGTLLIFDDVTGSINWDQPHYSQLFTEYRHLKCWIVVSTHYGKKVPPLIRESITKGGLFDQQSNEAYNALYDAVASNVTVWKKPVEFKNYLKRHCDKRKKTFVWYDRDATGDDYKFQPCIAPVVPDFYVNLTPVQEEKKDKKRKRDEFELSSSDDSKDRKRKRDESDGEDNKKEKKKKKSKYFSDDDFSISSGDSSSSSE